MQNQFKIRRKSAQENSANCFITHSRMVRVAQKLIMTVIYSNTLMEICLPEKLSWMCNFVHWTIFFGQVRCHKKFRLIETPPVKQTHVVSSSCKWHPLGDVY